MSLYKKNHLRVVSQSAVLSFYIEKQKNGELFFNPSYHSEFKFNHEHAQKLLDSIFNGGAPLEPVSLVLNDNSEPEKHCEIVDGQKRIKYLLGFYNNEYPYVADGVEFYFRDLCSFDATEFKKTKLPYNQIEKTKDGAVVTGMEKIHYYLTANQADDPQSKDHKTKLRLFLELNYDL